VKKYDKAKTPYRRVLACDQLPQETKDELAEQYNKLDPIALKEKLTTAQENLWKLAWIRGIKTAEEKKEFEGARNSKREKVSGNNAGQ
jgi:hypothetical protein